MTQDRKELMATLERVRQSYNERDQNILVPLLEEQLTNTDADGINFRKIGKKFLVDSTELRMRRGFDDLATLIANPNDNIRCDELSPIVDEVEFEPCAFHLSLLPELNNLEYLNRLLTIPGQLGPTEVNLATRSPLATRITYGLVRRKIELIETLEAMRNDRDLDDPELLFVERVAQIVDELVRINKALSGSTFGGKMKHDHNAYDRCRQRVSKRIREAIQAIEKHPDTAYIGQHLRENVKTGGQFCYFGKWRCWNL